MEEYPVLPAEEKEEVEVEKLLENVKKQKILGSFGETVQELAEEVEESLSEEEMLDRAKRVRKALAETVKEDDEDLKKIDEIIEDLEKGTKIIREEHKKFIEKVEQGLIEQKMTREDFENQFMEDLRKSIEKAEEAGDKIAVEGYRKILKQMENSRDFDILKQTARFHKTARREYRKNYQKEMKRAFEKLKVTKRYVFRPLSGLNAALRENLPEEYARYSKLFLYHFFKYINDTPLDDSAVFISQAIFNIISLLEKPNEQLIEHIVEVIDILLS